MSSRTRAVGLLGMFGSAFALLQCSELTQVDWSAIPAATTGGTTGSTGESAGMATAGSTGAGAAGASGEGGVAGESGAAGEAGQGEGGFGGSIAGGGTGGSIGGASGGGVSGGGTGGTGGSAGSAPLVHKTCSTAPTLGVAGAANLAGTLASALVFFDGGSADTGNRGGRTGLDTACQTAKNSLALPQQMTHAVISVSVTDDIFHMPDNYQVPRMGPHIVSPVGLEVAPTWDQLWQSAVPDSLICLGVMPPTSRTWLSGTGKATAGVTGEDAMKPLFGFYDDTTVTNTDPSNNTCNGWTLGVFDNNNLARVGSTTADKDALDTPPRFFGYRVDACSAANGNILCVAYDPGP